MNCNCTVNKERHITADGYILAKAPSLIGPIFPVRHQYSRTWADSTVHSEQVVGFAFDYWIGGEKIRYQDVSEANVEYERNRMTQFQKVSLRWSHD